MKKTKLLKPFSETIEFIGRIFDDENSIDGVHFEIFYSLINDDDISGNIIGSSKLSNDLPKLMNSKSMFLQLEADFEGEKISSKMLSLRNISGFKSARDPNGVMEYEVSKINLYDLQIDYLSKKDFNTNKRNLSFFLDGPVDIWNVRELKKYELNGSVKNEVKEFKLNLADDIKVIICPRYFYDNKSNEEDIEISTKKFSLVFETDLSLKEFSDDEFILCCTKICEDILLLASYLSKTWIIWYGYYFESPVLFRRYFRDSRDVDHIKVDRHSIPVDVQNINQFFEEGLLSLKKLRSNEIDITLPLTYYIVGQKGKHIEEQFSLLFLALEKIKDLYSIKKGISKNLLSSEFRRLTSNVKNLINGTEINEDKKLKIISKIPELNRPSLRDVLDSIFDEYGIVWKDLYPNASKFTLIKTRDLLFHSSLEIDSDELFRELNRLEIILDRLFLKMLGCHNISNVKKQYHNRWLVHYQ